MSNNTLRIIVGSINPVKIQAAHDAISPHFPDKSVICEGINAPSGVAEQPMTAKETRLGAVNRVKFCMDNEKADFYVSMEGGVDEFEDGPATFAYVVIANTDITAVGRSASLPLPKTMFDSLHSGQELGSIMDKAFKTENIKQKGGAIGLLTNGEATRQSTYAQALTLTFARFLHHELYSLE